MNFYAQLNEENICVGLSQTNGFIFNPCMIRIKSFDNSIVGKKYNNGVWENVVKPEPTPEPLSEMEQTILQTAINTEYIMILMETTI